MALAKADWVLEAVYAIAEGGTASVAVEAMAKRLHATKGSFYWHFADRRALVEEALDFWEREFTDAPITDAQAIEDPVKRVETLLARIMSNDRAGRADVGLLGSAHDPLVAPVFARVQAKRFAFLERCFRDLDFPPDVSRHRARIAYGGFIAWFEQRRIESETIPPDPELRAYQRVLVDLLCARRHGHSA